MKYSRLDALLLVLFVLLSLFLSSCKDEYIPPLPSAAKELKASHIATTHATLTWQKPETAGKKSNGADAMIVSYKLLVATNEQFSASHTTAKIINADTDTYQLSELRAKTRYWVKLSAKNNEGKYGAETSILSFVTLGVNEFVTIWKTNLPGASSDRQISLPLVSNGQYNFSAQWGDGTTSKINHWSAPQKTHTYPSAGTYVVTIIGKVIGWSFNPKARMGASTNALFGDANKLLNICNWGCISLDDTKGQFSGTRNLKIMATDAPDLRNTQSFEMIFLYSAIGDINLNPWNTSSITNMSRAFAHASQFKGFINSWDVSRVTSMERMFEGTPSFNDNISDWNVSKVKNMSRMFAGAIQFDQNLSHWQVAQVVNYQDVFLGALKMSRKISQQPPFAKIKSSRNN